MRETEGRSQQPNGARKEYFYNGGDILPFGLETEAESIFFGLEREMMKRVGSVGGGGSEWRAS